MQVSLDLQSLEDFLVRPPGTRNGRQLANAGSCLRPGKAIRTLMHGSRAAAHEHPVMMGKSLAVEVVKGR